MDRATGDQSWDVEDVEDVELTPYIIGSYDIRYHILLRVAINYKWKLRISYSVR